MTNIFNVFSVLAIQKDVQLVSSIRVKVNPYFLNLALILFIMMLSFHIKPFNNYNGLYKVDDIAVVLQLFLPSSGKHYEKNGHPLI